MLTQTHTQTQYTELFPICGETQSVDKTVCFFTFLRLISLAPPTRDDDTITRHNQDGAAHTVEVGPSLKKHQLQHKGEHNVQRSHQGHHRCFLRLQRFGHQGLPTFTKRKRNYKKTISPDQFWVNGWNSTSGL